MKIKFLAFAIVLFFISCADEDLAPVATFDTSGKGAYVRLISENERFVNLFDVPGSNYVYSVELVDLEQGALIQEYYLDLIYDDNTPDNGADLSKGPIRLKSFGASDFEDLASGFKGLSNISVSATEMLSALGITADQVGPGDVFIVDGGLVLDDGRVFTNANSTAAVRGSAFQGHFQYRLTAGCPSSLDGAYEYDASNYWCGAADASGTVNIVTLSAGVYAFDDWSFGGYGACYGPGSAAGSTSLNFSDVCAVVSYTGNVDVYGDSWTYTPTSIEGNDWTITWANTYGESGAVVIHYPGGGDWPITLSE